jgi:hypothetical protein
MGSNGFDCDDYVSGTNALQPYMKERVCTIRMNNGMSESATCDGVNYANPTWAPAPTPTGFGTPPKYGKYPRRRLQTGYYRLCCCVTKDEDANTICALPPTPNPTANPTPFTGGGFGGGVGNGVGSSHVAHKRRLFQNQMNNATTCPPCRCELAATDEDDDSLLAAAGGESTVVVMSGSIVAFIAVVLLLIGVVVVVAFVILTVALLARRRNRSAQSESETATSLDGFWSHHQDGGSTIPQGNMLEVRNEAKVDDFFSSQMRRDSLNPLNQLYQGDVMRLSLTSNPMQNPREKGELGVGERVIKMTSNPSHMMASVSSSSSVMATNPMPTSSEKKKRIDDGNGVIKAATARWL